MFDNAVGGEVVSCAAFRASGFHQSTDKEG